MYHKLGRPNRMTKTSFISIHEPASDFYYYYPLDDKGNLIRKEETGSPVFITKSKTDIEQNNSDSSDILIEELPDAIPNSANMEINSNQIISINNLLNKHPFPSLTTYDPNGDFLQQKYYQPFRKICY